MLSLRGAARIGLGLLLAGCVVTTAPASPTTPAPAAATSTPPAPAASPTPGRRTASLRVWLPPEFSPGTGTAAGQVLAEHIAQFEEAHPGESIEVRVKQAAGPGGLLRSLITAYNAAPAVLPNIVALNRDDLAAAAAAGLVVPLEPWISPEAIADYYPFAQNMARWQGETVALPFAAEARVLVYKTDAYASAPRAWPDVLTGTLVIPGGEPTALTVLNEYLALGGPLDEPSGEVVLDTELLTEALLVFQELQAAGVLPQSTITYTNPAATWQVFRERRANLAVTSAQLYMTESGRVSAAAAALIPTAGEEPLALADGWSWALVNTAPDQQAAAAELIAWLADPARLAEWSRAARVLPPRAGALAEWGNAPFTPFAAQVLTHARLQPPAEVLNAVGPLLRKALDDVLKGRSTPFTAATVASQSVLNPR